MKKKSLNFLDFNITNTINNKKPLPTYISKQHHALTLTPSKVYLKYLKVSFTEYTQYVPRNTSKKKKDF